MKITFFRIATHKCALSIVLLMASISPCSLGQRNSGVANVTLIARLESLSVTVSPSYQLSHTLDRDFLLVTTSWVAPSNRTTIRIVENGTIYLSEAIGESNQPRTRIVQLKVAIPDGRSNVQHPGDERGRVIIVVEAL